MSVSPRPLTQIEWLRRQLDQAQDTLTAITHTAGAMREALLPRRGGYEGWMDQVADMRRLVEQLHADLGFLPLSPPAPYDSVL